MAHVFISYSKQHRELTERLAALLEASSCTRPDGTSEPITVWWDQSLVSGDVFHREITREIDQAGAVVVIWSAGAAASDWVYAEAQRGAGQRKLVPLRDPALPHDRIPLPFAAFHIDNVGNDAAVVASVCKRLGGTPSEDVAGLAGDQRWLIDPKAEAPLGRTARTSPASLLQAKYRIVPFVDFGDRKAKLIAWAGGCDAAGAPIKTAGRVIHGPGGLGKTRLLIEVVRALADEGWLAGFVNRDTLGHATRGPQLENLIRTGREARGLFLVVDYAEGRTEDVKALARLMLERERAGGKPARLVLLARAAGDWWSELARSSTDVTDVFGIGEETLDEMRLGDIATGEPRVALWTQAAQALKPHLAKDFPDVCALDPAAPPNPELAARLQRVRSDPDYARPLAVQMEALLWLRGAAPGAHERGIPAMLGRMVGLERAHWQKVTAGIDAETLDRAVVQVTLVQGVDSRAQAMALLQADNGHFGERPPHQCKTIVGELAKFCGADSVDGEGDHSNGARQSDGLAPLEPDLIGEHFLAEKADPALVDACLRWIADAAGEAVAKRYHLLTVLLRATGGDHGKLAQQAAALLDHLAQQLSTIVPLLNDDEALAAIDAALPMQSLALMELSLHVAQRRLELARGLAGTFGVLSGVPDATASPRHGRAASRPSTTSDASSDKDVDGRDKRGHDATSSRWRRFKHYLARKLRAGAEAPAKQDSEQSALILAYLAARFGTLGNRLSDLGRRDDALAATQEAVKIYRRLAQQNTDAFLPDLAMSLNNLGMMLSNLGRRDDALAATQEAVDIRRRLAQQNTDAFLPDLARSLGAQGQVLAALERHGEAAGATAEGLEAIAPFVERHPQAFGELVVALAEIYVASCEQVGREPDAALLERIARALGDGA